MSPVPAVTRPLRIAVIGGKEATDEERALARALGGRLAEAGAAVVCGGRGGIMEAAARGAAESGGLTVGFLPGEDATEANPWISLPLPTGLGGTRNTLVAGTAEAVVAVGGAWGTLSEIAFARTRSIPVAVLGSSPCQGLDLPRFDDAVAAAAWAVGEAHRNRGEKPPRGSVV